MGAEKYALCLRQCVPELKLASIYAQHSARELRKTAAGCASAHGSREIRTMSAPVRAGVENCQHLRAAQRTRVEKDSSRLRQCAREPRNTHYVCASACRRRELPAFTRSTAHESRERQQQAAPLRTGAEKYALCLCQCVPESRTASIYAQHSARESRKTAAGCVRAHGS